MRLVLLSLIASMLVFTLPAQAATAPVLTFDYRVPAKVVDGRSATLRFRVMLRDGSPLPQEHVKLLNNKNNAAIDGVTDKRGWVKFSVVPTETARWYVEVQPNDIHAMDRSKRKRVRVVPPGRAVQLPGPAPRIKLPPQPKAVLPGPAVRISPIPDSVWASMQGKSWREGCTLRENLRYVQTNYWAYDGYRRQGELIIAASAASDFHRALTGLYKRRLPIRAMYLVDRFGYSPRLRGADDYKSMAAGNTSAFNCRNVVGRPGVRSPHSSGRAFDLNPWENPYAASHGWVPNKYWVGRSHPRVAWRSGSHPVVRTLRAAGFRWTYGVRDAHHFDA